MTTGHLALTDLRPPYYPISRWMRLVYFLFSRIPSGIRPMSERILRLGLTLLLITVGFYLLVKGVIIGMMTLCKRITRKGGDEMLLLESQQAHKGTKDFLTPCQMPPL